MGFRALPGNGGFNYFFFFLLKLSAINALRKKETFQNKKKIFQAVGCTWKLVDVEGVYVGAH